MANFAGTCTSDNKGLLLLLLTISGLPGFFFETWLLASSCYGFDKVLNYF